MSDTNLPYLNGRVNYYFDNSANDAFNNDITTRLTFYQCGEIPLSWNIWSYTGS